MRRLKVKLMFIGHNIMFGLICWLFNRSHTYRGPTQPWYTRFLDGKKEVINTLYPWCQERSGKIPRLFGKAFYAVGNWYYSNDYYQWDNRYMKRANWKGFA